MLTLILLVVCIIATGVSDYFGEPPNYLVGLLGTAAGAFFTAIGSDQNKRNAEVRHDAHDAKIIAERAERKADAGDVRADEAEQRESGPSQHRDGDGGGGG